MAEDTKPKPDTSADDGKNTDGSGAGAGTQTDKTEAATKSFTQDEVDRIAGEARKSEREKAKREKEEDERKRQEASDKEAGKHKELATKFEAERDSAVATAKATQEKLDALSEKLTTIVEAEIKALPEQIRGLAPNALEDRLEWLPKAKKSAEALTGEPKPGNSRGPKPAGTTSDDAVQSAYDRKRASGQYSR